MTSEARRLRLDDLLVEIGTLHAALPAGLVRPVRRQERVSGSTVPALPLRLDALDAGMPAHSGSVRDALRPVYTTTTVEVDVWLPARPGGPYGWRTVPMTQRVPLLDDDGAPVMQPSGDQVGSASVATVLDGWARDMASQRDEFLPRPTVSRLVPWLRDRLEWACEQYGPIDDFAAELRSIVGPLRYIVHGAEPEPERVDAPCRRCDRRDLTRLPGEDRIECGSCGDRATEDEYGRWVGEVIRECQ